jgi:hypothetical protein
MSGSRTQLGIRVKSCILTFRIFVGLGERGPVVSVWRNYSGLPTEPHPKDLFQTFHRNAFQWFQTFQPFHGSTSTS